MRWSFLNSIENFWLFQKSNGFILQSRIKRTQYFVINLVYDQFLWWVGNFELHWIAWLMERNHTPWNTYTDNTSSSKKITADCEIANRKHILFHQNILRYCVRIQNRLLQEINSSYIFRKFNDKKTSKFERESWLDYLLMRIWWASSLELKLILRIGNWERLRSS